MAEYLNTLASLSLSEDECGAEASGPCLDDDSILAFAQGFLKDEQLALVHSHMDRCCLCQRLVTEAAHALDADPISDSTRPSWNTVFQHNAVIGRRYRILRLIARGGMGEVYEAFDTELQERLALKTVTSTACDSARAVRLLKAEVQLARRISHPNVCRIYDFRTHEMDPSGAVINFLVMEFVEGECLGQKLREHGALPLLQAQSIAQQLLLGLRAAHQAGILHRDFKSDNVMLRTESNGRVVPVILDFGLAKALNESGNASSTLNQGQGMVGTIGYMSPEQLEGQPLSMASDIYSFGVLWFELLTGRLPFVGESPVAAAMARLHQDPPPPSSINPQVPGWLDEIVLCCLSRSRLTRFNEAEQVLEALALQTVSPVKRSPVTRAGWSAALLVAVVGALSLVHGSMRPPNAVNLTVSTNSAMPAVPVPTTGDSVPVPAPRTAKSSDAGAVAPPASTAQRPTTKPPAPMAHSKASQPRSIEQLPELPAPPGKSKSPPDWLPP
jgi:serine/threonine protein kinase